MDDSGRARVVESQSQPTQVTAIGQRINYGPFTIETVDILRVDPIEKNARFMRNETFRQLVDNIKNDGALSQIPFCVKAGDRFITLSGNHRLKAALEAGETVLPIIYPTHRELTRAEQVAIQISHNAIAGDDDPIILLELFNELGTVSDKLYTGIDDKALAQLEAVDISQIDSVKLNFRILSFFFMPEEISELKDAFDDASKRVSSSETYLANMKDFDDLLTALAEAKSSANVANVATGLQVVLAVYRKHRDELTAHWWDKESGEMKEGKHNQWVPLSSIIDSDVVPADAAAVIKKAVTKMRDSGDLQSGSLWKAFEYWAADYLAGDSGE